MDRNCKTELLGALAKGDDAWEHANGGDGDVPRADPEPLRTVEDRERGVDGGPIHHRLTHSHEYHVGHGDRRTNQRHLAHLRGDLPRAEVALEAHATCRTEGALERAPRLR